MRVGGEGPGLAAVVLGRARPSTRARATEAVSVRLATTDDPPPSLPFSKARRPSSRPRPSPQPPSSCYPPPALAPPPMSSSAGLVAREAAGRQLASPTAAASSWTPSSLSPDGRSPASLASLASAPASRADSVGSRFGQLIQHLQQGSFVPGDAAVLRAGGGALSLGALDGGGGPPPIASPTPSVPDGPPADGGGNVLIILLPLLIVLSTLLFLILVFLVFVIVLKRKSRIRSVPRLVSPPCSGLAALATPSPLLLADLSTKLTSCSSLPLSSRPDSATTAGRST